MFPGKEVGTCQQGPPRGPVHHLRSTVAFDRFRDRVAPIGQLTIWVSRGWLGVFIINILIALACTFYIESCKKKYKTHRLVGLSWALNSLLFSSLPENPSLSLLLSLITLPPPTMLGCQLISNCFLIPFVPSQAPLGFMLQESGLYLFCVLLQSSPGTDQVQRAQGKNFGINLSVLVSL